MASKQLCVTVRISLIVALFISSLQLLAYLTASSLQSPYTRDSRKGTPRLARQIPASELLSRRPADTGGRIPKIFHQSWKTLELPARFRHWSLSCRRKHPDWEWVVWTDEDNLALVQKHFPWLEEAYRGLPGVIYQADLARNLYMYIYGGVYADLDTECLRPTEDLQRVHGSLFNQQDGIPVPATAIFGRMGNDPDFEHSIPNAWMASTPGHRFFLAALQEFMDLYNQTTREGGEFPDPESVTGPVALRNSLARYESNRVLHGPGISDAVAGLARGGPFPHTPAEEPRVLLLPSHALYAYSWGGDGEYVRDMCWVVNDGFDAGRCKDRLDTRGRGSISITYWSHTHSPTGHDEENMKHITE